MKLSDVVDRELDRLESLTESGKGAFWNALRRSRMTLVILPLAVALLHWREVPAQLSKATLDAAIALQPRTEPKQVRVVTIDDQDYAGLFGSRSPLNPSALSQLIAAIDLGRPKVVVVDIDTSNESFKNLSVSVDLPIVWAMSDNGWKGGKTLTVKPIGGAVLPPLWREGMAEIPHDKNWVVRSYWRMIPAFGGPVPSIELAAADAYRGRQSPGSLLPASKNERTLDFRYVLYPMNARTVLEYAKTPGWPEGVLQGKIVILGGSYHAGRDQYATPVGVLDGVGIVAQATQAEMDDSGIPPSGPWLGIVEILAGITVIALYQFLRLRTAMLISLALLPILSLAGSLIVYHRFSGWLAFTPALAIVLISELYAKASMYRTLCSKVIELASKTRDDKAGEHTTESGE